MMNAEKTGPVGQGIWVKPSWRSTAPWANYPSGSATPCSCDSSQSAHSTCNSFNWRAIEAASCKAFGGIGNSAVNTCSAVAFSMVT